MIKHIPHSVAIFGAGPSAVNVALRSALKLNKYAGPLVILDYTGRGAMILGKGNETSFPVRSVNWYDLADRHRPVAFFQLRRSGHFRQILLRVLKIMRQISRIPVTNAALEWATEAAYNLSSNGTVGLLALLKSLSNPDVRRWFVNTQIDPNILGQLIKMLKWVLRFPSVYAISESINRANGNVLKYL
jgi:hypothetical protein